MESEDEKIAKFVIRACYCCKKAEFNRSSLECFCKMKNEPVEVMSICTGWKDNENGRK